MGWVWFLSMAGKNESYLSSRLLVEPVLLVAAKHTQLRHNHSFLLFHSFLIHGMVEHPGAVPRLPGATFFFFRCRGCARSLPPEQIRPRDQHRLRQGQVRLGHGLGPDLRQGGRARDVFQVDGPVVLAGRPPAIGGQLEQALGFRLDRGRCLRDGGEYGIGAVRVLVFGVVVFVALALALVPTGIVRFLQDPRRFLAEPQNLL
mmetsp:Transcript_9782/g.20470  ORF Transcript_9782/g.20470 Transcript_9782/m.20470 type:complete len:203 (-) Transcript_9782:320-928(-)